MFLIVDLETNGLWASDDILQIAVLEVSNKIEKVINRYYFPRGKLNPDAVEVHGLTLERIEELRKKQKATYPNHFEEDGELLDYLKRKLKSNVLVAFNVNFEKKFLEHRGIRVYRTLDLMKVYTPLCGIRHEYYGLKYPKLSEAVSKFVKPLPWKAFDLMHSALVDAYFTYRLLKLYPYLNKWRVEEFEEEFQKDMFKEYPAELWLKPRFSYYWEKLKRQRKLEREFLECLENCPDGEFIIWKNYRVDTDKISKFRIRHISRNNKKFPLNTPSRKRRAFYLFYQFLQADRVREVADIDIKREQKIFNLGNAFLVWFKIC
jgi:DNA polymerase III epsilon subunit-like protein